MPLQFFLQVFVFTDVINNQWSGILNDIFEKALILSYFDFFPIRKHFARFL